MNAVTGFLRFVEWLSGKPDVWADISAMFLQMFSEFTADLKDAAGHRAPPPPTTEARSSSPSHRADG